MTFSDEDKLKALAIVNIFETSRPFGDYAACVVLNDGAGVSYGINQFTHRSGSLAAVVETYLNNGGLVGGETLRKSLPLLCQHSAIAVNNLAVDERFKYALRAAATSPEMKAAQTAVAFEKYLRPALEICAMRGFTLPLSLAVIYDSMTHGSWERISRLISKADEKAWITAYVRKRHLWLTNIPRLNSTNYRTKFFLDQIAISNWDLRMPTNVHGVRLTDAMFRKILNEKAVEPNVTTTPKPPNDTAPRISLDKPAPIPQAQPPARREEVEETTSGADEENGFLETTANAVGTAAEKFDQVDNVVAAVATRKDAAKSLWTTVAGTLWQMVWAIFGFFVGLPREVWIVVAVIAASLTLLYLYRQIEMGKIREKLRTGNYL